MSDAIAPVALLTAPTLRSDLRRMVRRRVPERDVDDVIQEVLCDALASPLPTTSARDVARWVMAIARNKIADYHRRACREPLVDGRNARPTHAEPSTPSSADRVEHRELLSLAMGEATREPRDRETLEWILREMEGERLDDIARRIQVEPPAARQRVSRLRKRLRTALLFAAVLGSIGLAWLGTEWLAPDPGPLAITPDAPVERPDPPVTAPAAATLDGDWTIEALETSNQVAPALRAVMQAQAPATRIVVSGTDVTIVTPARSLRGSLSLTPTETPGTYRGHLESPIGTSPIELVMQGSRLTVSSTDGAIAGSVTLTRR